VTTLTGEQLQSRKGRAVRFVRDVSGDPDRAAEIEDEDLDDYADRRRILLANFNGDANMANDGNSRTKADLLDEIDQLQQENQDLQDQLDAIADIVSPSDRVDGEDGDGDYGDDLE
jgi:hypothetical protein